LPTPVSAPQTASVGERSGRPGGGAEGEGAEAPFLAGAAATAAPRGGHGDEEENLRAAKTARAAVAAPLLLPSARPRAASSSRPVSLDGAERVEEVEVEAATAAVAAAAATATEAFRIGIEGKTKTGAPQYFPVTLAERSRRGREYPRAAMRNDKNLYEVTARDKSFGMKTLEQIGF
jgi:hypothetical protein